MTISPEELWQAMKGEADEEVRKRVLQAIEDGDPAVLKIMEERKKRAQAWLKLLEDQNPEIIEMGPEGKAAEKNEGKGDD